MVSCGSEHGEGNTTISGRFVGSNVDSVYLERISDNFAMPERIDGAALQDNGGFAFSLNIEEDMDNLRYNKVIIATDADVDGFQIRTLVLTMIYRLAPTLIEQGYVYIAESPLYEINSKNNTYFAFDEKEKADILKKLEGQKYTIQRSKGLGENQPEMMWETTMNPETRRLIRVMSEDVEPTSTMFDLLLGDNLADRKEYIAENGHLYLDMLDLS